MGIYGTLKMNTKRMILSALAIAAFCISSYAGDYDWLIAGNDTPVYTVASIKCLPGRCIFTLNNFTGNLEFNPTTTDGKILLSTLLTAKSTSALVTAYKNGLVAAGWWYVNQINIK
jgi:hypothetical protein